MPLTAKLVELLGGKVTLESTLGVGSTFRARIPRLYMRPTAPLPELQDAPDDPRIPVLFVDDHVETLRGLGLVERTPDGSLALTMEARVKLANLRSLLRAHPMPFG